MYKDMIIYLLKGIKNKKDFAIFTMVLCKCAMNKDINLDDLYEILEELAKSNMGVGD